MWDWSVVWWWAGVLILSIMFISWLERNFSSEDLSAQEHREEAERLYRDAAATGSNKRARKSRDLADYHLLAAERKEQE